MCKGTMLMMLMGLACIEDSAKVGISFGKFDVPLLSCGPYSKGAIILVGHCYDPLILLALSLSLTF
jgi:hypothetical protein